MRGRDERLSGMGTTILLAVSILMAIGWVAADGALPGGTTPGAGGNAGQWRTIISTR